MSTTAIIITPEQLHDAASALAGTVEELDTVEQAQARLWTWLQHAVGALIDDAAVYATSQRRGFQAQAFEYVRSATERNESDADTETCRQDIVSRDSQ